MPTDKLHTASRVAETIGVPKRTVLHWTKTDPARLTAAGWRLVAQLDGVGYVYRPVDEVDAA